jgi:hypothetical protein
MAYKRQWSIKYGVKVKNFEAYFACLWTFRESQLPRRRSEE